jgi:hypothetical protein
MLSSGVEVELFELDNLGHILFWTFPRFFCFEERNGLADEPDLSAFIDFHVSRQDLLRNAGRVFLRRAVDHLCIPSVEPLGLVAHGEVEVLPDHLAVGLLALGAQFVHDAFAGHDALPRVCVAAEHGD